MCKKFTVIEASDQESVTVLISMLDRVDAGISKFEARLRGAMARQETGSHVLRVRVNGGAVKAVVHGVEDEM